MAFIGQETVRKQQRHDFLWLMYTLIAVFVHFNRVIDLKINFHPNPYNLASTMLLSFWAPCGCMLLVFHMCEDVNLSQTCNHHYSARNTGYKRCKTKEQKHETIPHNP